MSVVGTSLKGTICGSAIVMFFGSFLIWGTLIGGPAYLVWTFAFTFLLIFLPIVCIIRAARRTRSFGIRFDELQLPERTPPHSIAPETREKKAE